MHKKPAIRALTIIVICVTTVVGSGTGLAFIKVPRDRSKAQAAPLIGAPHLSGEIVVSAIDGSTQYGSATAYNTNRYEYLVAWTNGWGVNYDIYAQRVSASGQLVGPTGFAVTFGAGDRTWPSIAYDPTHDRYLVVWMYDNGGSTDIYARLIPWHGPDPGFTEFIINSTTARHIRPVVAAFNIDATNIPEKNASVACDASGGQYLAVWEEEDTGSFFGSIWGRSVNSDKTLGQEFTTTDTVYGRGRRFAGIPGRLGTRPRG